MKFASSKNFTLFASACVAMAVSGCMRNPNKPTYEYVPHMMDQPAVKAQELGPYGEGMRVPPEGTLHQESPEPYRYPKDPDTAGRILANPVARNMEMLRKGQHLYNTYCIVCHGKKGMGDGTIVPKFPQPPTLHSDKVRDWSDGRIYHVITMGQNLMPSYASQMNPEERWAVVNYVRVLQRTQNPSAADVARVKKMKAER